MAISPRSLHRTGDQLYPWLLVGFCGSVLLLPCLWPAAGDLPTGFRPLSPLALGGLACAALLFLVRLVLACRYRPCPILADEQLPAVTVIVPAYNEGAQVLSTLQSILASDYPGDRLQVVAVDDGSLDDTWTVIQSAVARFPAQILPIRLKRNRGKRRALMRGFLRATGSIYVTVDSDSEIEPHTLRALVSPLAHDPRVGAVAGQVRVMNLTARAIPRMLDVAFTVAFDFIRSGQSVYGGVFCTPGALSAYRASDVNPYLFQWLNQTFLGQEARIGEDRALTNLILSQGKRVVYQRSARVHTQAPVTYDALRKMLLRWARSGVRESLVMQGYLWRRFRPASAGAGWLRLFGALTVVRMTVGEGLKILWALHLLRNPLLSLGLTAIGVLPYALFSGWLHRRHAGGQGVKWAYANALYTCFALPWISIYALWTAKASSWLTRQLPPTKTSDIRIDTTAPAS